MPTLTTASTGRTSTMSATTRDCEGLVIGHPVRGLSSKDRAESVTERELRLADIDGNHDRP